MQNPTRSLLLDTTSIAAFCVLLFFFGLSSFGLVGPDEPRYAQVAREMFEREDLVTPTLYGEKWLEKPALYYWRAMFAYSVFGVQDWAARVPSATFAVMLVAIVYVHMRRFRPGAELDAALITASAAGIIGFARGASTDMQLAAPFAVAMLGWYAWYETGKKLWLFDFYFFLAVATLAKGPVAVVLSALVLSAFLIFRRDAEAARRTLWWPGLLLFFVVTLPWYIAVQIWNPEFFRVFILEHNLARYTSEVHSHVQPFWFYVPVLLIALVPWTALAVVAIASAAKDAWHQWQLKKENLETRHEAFPEFLLIWGVMPLLFFSVSQAKLPGYILPALPPCTILAADYIQRRRGTAMPRTLALVHALLVGALLAVVLLLPHLMMYPKTAPGGAARNIALAVCAVAIATVFLTLRRGGWPGMRLATLVPVVVAMGFLLKVGAPVIDQVYSPRTVARTLNALGAREIPVALYMTHRDTEYGLAYYRNQRIHRYERGEVPHEEHVLIARSGRAAEAIRMVQGRKVERLGADPRQRLDYYRVSAR